MRQVAHEKASHALAGLESSKNFGRLTASGGDHRRFDR